jgi:hypothetical protein
MSGRHRKPTTTQLRLAKAGAMTMMATLPLTLASTAFAAEASAKDRDSRSSDHDTRYADEYDSYLASDSDDEDNDSNSRSHRSGRDSERTFSRSDYGYDSDSNSDDEDSDSRSSRSRSRHAATDTDDLPLIGRHASERRHKSIGRSKLRQERSPQVSSTRAAKWDRLAQCESTQNWNANTGNGFKGGLQFTDSTWRAYGGHKYAPAANKASRAEQIAVAEKVQQGQGWGAWPACSRKLGYA